MSWLRWLASSSSNRHPREAPRTGLIYVSDADDGVMTTAREGAVVTLAAAPPWLVVNDDPGSVIAASWPGRLWRVEVLEAAPQRDQPLAYARYVRAMSVRVLREEPASILFGSHGEAVIEVISAARSLKPERAAALAVNRSPGAPAAEERLWRRWLDSLNSPRAGEDHIAGTLYMQGEGGGSPINHGLLVLDRAVFERAEKLGAVTTETIDGEEEYVLLEPWPDAEAALLDAALALGAPHLTEDADAEALLQAWRRAFPRD